MLVIIPSFPHILIFYLLYVITCKFIWRSAVRQKNLTLLNLGTPILKEHVENDVYWTFSINFHSFKKCKPFEVWKCFEKLAIEISKVDTILKSF